MQDMAGMRLWAAVMTGAIGLHACSEAVGGGRQPGDVCSAGSDCMSGMCSGKGLCQEPGDAGGGDAGGGCTLNADCAALGQYFICNKKTTQCVSLVSHECTTVHTTKANPADAFQDDNAVIFGSILPTIGVDAPYGKLLEDSIKLALDDFGKVGGLPGLTGGSNRPIVLVGCNDGPNEDRADAVAKHLAEEVGVPAIIGYAYSGNTIQIADDVTIPDKVLLFTPSATNAEIGALVDDDLVWSTAPSDSIQAITLAAYYSDVEAAAKKRYPMIAQNPIKVAIVSRVDSYGSGLGDTLEAILKFNGQSATSQAGISYLRVVYDSPNLANLTTIVSFHPDVIFELGFNEGPDTIFTQVEKAWAQSVPTDGHFPFWVFSDGGEVSSLWASSTMPTMPADITTEDQRQRVTGTAPGVSQQSWPPYGTFLNEFQSSPYGPADGSADTLGPAGAYDILYLLAYSTVMVDKNPLTGPNLVKYGLRRMQKGPSLPKVQIGSTNILSTFPLLSATMPIDVTGVSGPLPFDKNGVVATADSQIWCVPKAVSGPDVGAPAIKSGRFYDSTAQMMGGAISASCGFP